MSTQPNPQTPNQNTQPQIPAHLQVKLNKQGIPEHLAKYNENYREDSEVPDHIANLNENHGAISGQTENIADEVGSEADEKIVNESKPKKKPAKKEPEKAPEKKIVKLKYDGKEEDYDIGNEKNVIRDLQLAKASTKRFEEASQLKNQTVEMLKAMNNNPDLVLKQLGWNDEKLNKWYTEKLYQEVTFNNMSPREKELYKREQQLKNAELQRQQQEQQAKEAQHKEKWVKTEQELQTMLISAWNTRKDIPKNQQTAIRALYYMQQAVERGVPIDASHVLDQVKQDLVDEHKGIYGGLDEDNLLSLLGDDIIKKINKGLVKKVKKEPVKIQSSGNPLPKKKAPGEFNDKDDFFKYLQNLPRA